MISKAKLNLNQLPRLELKRDVSLHLKRGHRWIFADCFDILLTKNLKNGIYELHFKGQFLGIGVVQSDTELFFRMILLNEAGIGKKRFHEKEIEELLFKNWKLSVQLRKPILNESHNSFRLINGEGDGFPGLVVDVYSDVAVIKYDHPIMNSVWDKSFIAKLIKEEFSYINCIYLKKRNDEEVKGENIIGELPENTIFKENGAFFETNIKDAAKTGFFLDQRDNRLLLKKFSKDKSVLNLFSYTGGFSIFAGLGGAKKVTSVDIAKNAIIAANRNFELNKIENIHEGIAEDAFLYISTAIKSNKKFDIVITDPPSFAPNKKSVDSAKLAYEKVYSDSIKLVSENGLFVASSCSSHITESLFLDIVAESFKKAKKRGTVLYIGGQPVDHPFPLSMPELKYLKFALFRVD